MRRTQMLLAVPVALWLAGGAWAQDNGGEVRGYGAVLDNIDLLIDHYSGFLARKYDLTDEQDQYTRQMLRDRAHSFLDKHDEDLRSLIDELFDARSGGDMTPEQLLQWGEQARPLYDEAKKLIIDGNNDWREILTPEQKKIHDADLKLMYQSFATTEDQLDRIASGEMTVEEFRNPRRSARATRRANPRTSVARNEPPPPPDPGEAGPARGALDPARHKRSIKRDRRVATQSPDMRRDAPAPPDGAGRRQLEPPPDKGQPPPPPETGKPVRRARRSDTPVRRAARPGATSAQGFEGEWDKYVADFIAKFNLDDAQQQQAHAILEDCKTQANRYVQGRKSTIERIDEQIADLQAVHGDPGDKGEAKKRAEQLSKLNDKKTEMREPIGRIFEKQLKPRLDRIPTRAQRRAAEEAANKGHGKREKRGAGAKEKP